MEKVGSAAGRGRSKKAASTPRGGNKKTANRRGSPKRKRGGGTQVEYSDDENATKRQKRIKRELERICARHGALTPELVLNYGEDPKSVLHKEFEWNDTVAGREYRLEQARNLIKAQKKVVKLTEELLNEPPKIARVRQYSSAGVSFRYLPREQVISEEELREKMVNERLGALRAWCTSVIDIPECTQLRRGIEKLLRGK